MSLRRVAEDLCVTLVAFANAVGKLVIISVLVGTRTLGHQQTWQTKIRAESLSDFGEIFFKPLVATHEVS